MSEGGVREKSLLEELESLDLDQSVKERIIKKYWNEVERQRAEIERIREETYREVREGKRSDIEKSTIISVLAAYIKEKELL
nr:MAG TPA: hypothetical protein [Caudoviricetes sp.]